MMMMMMMIPLWYIYFDEGRFRRAMEFTSTIEFETCAANDQAAAGEVSS